MIYYLVLFFGNDGLIGYLGSALSLLFCGRVYKELVLILSCMAWENSL